VGWLTRLANVVRRPDLDAEIEEELQFHIDATIDENVAAGMSPGEARRDALRRFGGRAGLRERTRDANLMVGLEHTLQDLRHGLRMLLRTPVLSAICIVSIAFGTGANVAVFSMADALLLRPLTVPNPTDVITVGTRALRGTFYRTVASYRDYLDMRDRAGSFAGLAAYTYESAAIAPRASDAPRVRFLAFVSDNFFAVLGVELQLGRGFLPDEDGKAGRGAVAVISDALWRGSYGADPAILGRRIHVGKRDFTIVGVTAHEYTGVDAYIPDSVFLPAGLYPQVADGTRPDALEARDVRVFTLKGRLRPGVTLSDARAELTTIEHDFERAYPETHIGEPLVAETEVEYKYERHPLDSALIVILSVLSMAVLGVASANVAGLLTSRAPVRAREMALRLAIGAARARLVRQLLMESGILAGLGALGGLAVGYSGIGLLRQIPLPTDLVSRPRFEMDERTLVFSLCVAMASACLAGLGPALQTTRVDLTSALKAFERGSSGQTPFAGRSLLVAVQVGLSLSLVTLTVFAIQVVGGELSRGPGWRVTHAAAVHIDAGQAGYAYADAARFYERLVDRARALPGVEAASLTSTMPMFHFHVLTALPEGRRLTHGEVAPLVWEASIEERYFDTMGIALLAGRTFSAADAAGTTPVAIVNDTLARHYWPGTPAIGKRLQIAGAETSLVEVVGIVRTTTLGIPGELPQNGIYFPYRQRPSGYMTLLATTRGDSDGLIAPLIDLVHRADPDVPIYDPLTMEQFFGARVAGFGGILVELAGGMGFMGVTLTLVGLYGMVSYSVNRRTREIGIRIAVGATYARIIRMVLGEGMTPVVLGLGLGLAGSVASWRLMSQLVPYSHQVTPGTYAIVVPILVTLTLIAAFFPARRAARVNPTEALRAE
jgi:predicted permease